MRKSILLIFLASFLFNCQEIPPIITPLQPDGNTGNFKRRVLIEEFTGVRCVNCPAGTQEILNLRGVYKEQLISVGIHAGSFAPPYPDSKIDFRTPEGDGILNLLGRPIGYPSAVVNRKEFEKGSGLQLGRPFWADFIKKELAQAPVVEVKISSNYNPSTRLLNLSIEVEALQTLPDGEIRLSVMLAEDNVVDVQLTPDGKKSDYAHRHNLRDMLTAFDGDSIGSELRGNKKVGRNYSLTLPATWDAKNCSVIAFAHLAGDKLDVLQANEGKILP